MPTKIFGTDPLLMHHTAEEWKYDSRNPKVMSGERKPPALGGGVEGRS